MSPSGYVRIGDVRLVAVQESQTALAAFPAVHQLATRSTRGHSLVRVCRSDQTALFVGDAMHAELRRRFPHVNAAADA
jgi:hypothetical protein